MNVYFQSFHPAIRTSFRGGTTTFILERKEDHLFCIACWISLPTKNPFQTRNFTILRLLCAFGNLAKRTLTWCVHTSFLQINLFVVWGFFNISLDVSPSHLSEKQIFGNYHCHLTNSVWKRSSHALKALLMMIISPKPANRQHNMAKQLIYEALNKIAHHLSFISFFC